MANRRETSKNETRQMILKAARKLFAQKDMEECTLRDIAKKAGVSPASIVVHFKSKTALLEEAINSDIKTTLSELMATIPHDGELLDRITHIPKGLLSLYDKNRNLYRALIRYTIFEPASETPNIAYESDQYIHFLSLLIDDEKAKGAIKHDIDSKIAALAVSSFYIGAIVMLLRTPEMTVEEVTTTMLSMTDQYLKGITNT